MTVVDLQVNPYHHMGETLRRLRDLWYRLTSSYDTTGGPPAGRHALEHPRPDQRPAVYRPRAGYPRRRGRAAASIAEIPHQAPPADPSSAWPYTLPIPLQSPADDDCPPQQPPPSPWFDSSTSSCDSSSSGAAGY